MERGARPLPGEALRRADLEHLIRAAASIADDREIVIIGSQAILGQFPDAPAALLVSVEADLYPRNHPERWDLIDGSIGEGSPFHLTFGYYAQGVGESTAVLPDGWKERLVPIHGPQTAGATGLALEIGDLMISKYVAARPKDRDFVSGVARQGMVASSTLLERLASTPLDPSRKAAIEAAILADFASARR